MAITAPHFQIMKALKLKLPAGGTVLQIGEANWYGELAPDFPCASTNLFDIARAFYADLFAPSRIVSVDINGGPEALRNDLNRPLPIDEQFDLVINHGTAEHVFNIGQVFKTMHDRCIHGGLMIHESPFTGWVEHGFYSLHPTLFYDLAFANCYEIVLIALETIHPPQVIRINNRDHVHRLAENGELPADSMLFVVYRKIADGEFRLPMQGIYRGVLSAEAQAAWRKMQ